MSQAIGIDGTRSERGSFSIFSYGFRPFFLAAGIYAILPLVLWIFYYVGLLGDFASGVSMQGWHAHEMLFGFVAAGMNGFLLTAIPNWTQTPPLTGRGLRYFFTMWLAGRVAFWLFLFADDSSVLYPWLSALLFVDLLLPVAHAVRVSRIFIATKNRRNFIFIGLLSFLAIANLLIILELNQLTEATAQLGSLLALNLMMIMIAVISGRVTPNFTRIYLLQNRIAGNVRSWPLIEGLAIGLLVLNALVDLVVPHSLAAYGLVLLACAVHVIRFSGWQGHKVSGSPIIWVLHAGYVWLIAALFLKGMEGFLGLPSQLYIHAFAVGAIGLYMMGIMSRASLGHTGRPLVVSSVIAVGYGLVFLAAIIRVVTPFFPGYYNEGMVVATLFWVGAYSLYLWVYVPILAGPRVDGRPG